MEEYHYLFVRRCGFGTGLCYDFGGGGWGGALGLVRLGWVLGCMRLGWVLGAVWRGWVLGGMRLRYAGCAEGSKR
jgi:hypothetical protein